MTTTVAVRSLVRSFYDEARGEVARRGWHRFRMPRREIFGLLEPTRGKTTTLRMLAHDPQSRPPATRR